MRRSSTMLSLAAGLAVALLAFAFIVAPHSCAWGNGAYATAGCVVVAALFLMPLLFTVGRSWWRRGAAALGLAFAGAVVWVAGFMIADFRVICRLI